MIDGQSASILAHGLQKQFGGKLVLRDFSLSVAPGAIFGLFGPSGSGKSTCIHLCCGHLRPDGGSLRVLGEEPARFTRATLLITTQYIDEAEYCDRIGLMYDGALITEGRPSELRREAFGGDLVDVVVADPSARYLKSLGGLKGVRQTDGSPDRAVRLVADDAQRAIPRLLETLRRAGAEVQSVAPYQPSFDEA